MEIEFLINHYFQKLANHLVRFQQVRYGYINYLYLMNTFTFFPILGWTDKQRGRLYSLGVGVLPRAHQDGALEYLSVKF